MILLCSAEASKCVCGIRKEEAAHIHFSGDFLLKSHSLEECEFLSQIVDVKRGFQQSHALWSGSGTC